MRRSLIIFAFMYFSIDSIFFLMEGGWPFTTAQWALVALIVVMVAMSVYQGKLMIKEEKEKKEQLKAEEERLKAQEAEEDLASGQVLDEQNDAQETISKFDD